MATVSQVIRVQPAPGKYEQCLEFGRKLRRIRERYAVKEGLFQTQEGHLIVVIETQGWKQFGEYVAKLQDDPEARALLAQFRADPNPVGTILDAEIAEEIPG